MATKTELKTAFWQALSKDRTAMVGCTGVYPRPMTAQVEGEHGPIWLFTAKQNDLAEATARKPQDGLLMFASKDHELFATVGGTLSEHTDPTVVDRLWNPFVAAWYSGKDDPNLRLLRFDPGSAEIWHNASSLWAGIKMLVGVDPKKDYRDEVAVVRLGAG